MKKHVTGHFPPLSNVSTFKAQALNKTNAFLFYDLPGEMGYGLVKQIPVEYS